MPRTIRFSLIVGAVLGLGAAGYAGFWFYAAQEMRENIGRWTDARRAEGFEVSHDGLAIAGFPFRLAASLSKPSLAAPHLPERWIWRGARAAAWARPWHMRRVHVSMTGPQTIEFTPRGETAPARVAFAEGSGLLGFDPAGRIEGARLRIGELEVVRGTYRGTRIKKLLATFLSLAPGSDAPADTVSGAVSLAASRETSGDAGARAEAEFGVAADGFELGPAIQAALGPRITRLAAEATIFGALPPGPAEAALAAWRDGGGKIEVKRISLRWAALRLDAAGTVALDAEMRPKGALKARVRGFDETLDALTATKIVTSRNAKIAKVVLGLMAKNSADGGGREIELPLTARDGKLHAGPFALMAVPRIFGE